MEPGIAITAVAAGYLAGSISSARIVARRIDPAVDVTRIVTTVGDGHAFTSTSASATAVRMKVGRRWGVLTAVLDMLKVALPALVLRLAFPADPYCWLAAGAGLVGHNWPLYHRFVGGRGETAIYGALLALDPAGAIAMLVVGMGLGFVAGNVLVLRWAGMVLMVPWAWLGRGDPAFGAYAVFAVATYLVAMRPELTQYLAMQGGSHEPTNEEIADEFGMGAPLGRAIDRYGLPGLLRRMRTG